MVCVAGYVSAAAAAAAVAEIAQTGSLRFHLLNLLEYIIASLRTVYIKSSLLSARDIEVV